MFDSLSTFSNRNFVRHLQRKSHKSNDVINNFIVFIGFVMNKLTNFLLTYNQKIKATDDKKRLRLETRLFFFCYLIFWHLSTLTADYVRLWFCVCECVRILTATNALANVTILWIYCRYNIKQRILIWNLLNFWIWILAIITYDNATNIFK